ncbi:hypothetical protein [Echinicola vietnamensis]|uniref:DUF7793 domain-containing protein n=1 Tax=Echinicola vietnamensis (strain DSM 17526 / LMG 23754 / KMM 6221) TaxID=926556 RepID=L0G060_ECHVK|nr:hypothetical protein [Echinicola vietnamensis]AGA78937.1 hypothetical protein Echvi_2697 [Echinicola vietnamensis DSM 17526]
MQYITTNTQEFQLLDNGIIFSRVLPNKYLELEDGRENLKAVATLAPGKRVAIVVDISQAKGISKECRALYGTKQCAEIQYAAGIVAKSKFSKLLGKFFLGFNKPLFPIRLFSDSTMAMEWLKTMKDDEKK